MKTLLLLRHAKSSWNDNHLSDHERPLNLRGKRDASRMGRLLLEKNLVPDLILSSTAKRAHLTAQKVAWACGYKGKMEYIQELYESDTGIYLQVLAQQGGCFDRILIVGHNPEMETFLAMLTGNQEKMPTAALAHLQLFIDQWKDISSIHVGDCISLWKPKELF